MNHLSTNLKSLVETRRQILSYARNLKNLPADSKLKRVVLKVDLTKLEPAAEKILVCELKRRRALGEIMFIRKDAIVTQNISQHTE